MNTQLYFLNERSCSHTLKLSTILSASNRGLVEAWPVVVECHTCKSCITQPWGKLPCTDDGVPGCWRTVLGGGSSRNVLSPPISQGHI